MNVASDRAIKGSLMFDEPMSKHTSWRLGGPADQYYVPADLTDLQYFLAQLEPEIETCGSVSAVTCWYAMVVFAAWSSHR